MKINIKPILPYALLFGFYLLVCILISVLYSFDWISTSSFHLSCLICSCFLYVIAGFVLFYSMKKRQFIIALSLSILLFLLKFFFQDSLNDLLQYGVRLILFLCTVFILQLRNNQ